MILYGINISFSFKKKSTLLKPLGFDPSTCTCVYICDVCWPAGLAKELVVGDGGIQGMPRYHWQHPGNNCKRGRDNTHATKALPKGLVEQVKDGGGNQTMSNFMSQMLELEIKHKHGGFNINYEKATVVWQQFGFGL
jgi:hypothetical protein